jgi:hypothetical protein
VGSCLPIPKLSDYFGIDQKWGINFHNLPTIKTFIFCKVFSSNLLTYTGKWCIIIYVRGKQKPQELKGFN